MNEIWKDIEGYEGLYQVSNLGRVRKLANVSRRLNRWGTYTEYHQKERIIKPAFDSDKQYQFVSLSYQGKKQLVLVHRLVAKAFIPNPDNLPQVNHKDENTTNNRADNLEWVTQLVNNNHGTGIQRREKHPKTVIQLSLSGEFIREWPSINAAAESVKANPSQLGHCCKGERPTAKGYRWKYKQA